MQLTPCESLNKQVNGVEAGNWISQLKSYELRRCDILIKGGRLCTKAHAVVEFADEVRSVITQDDTAKARLALYKTGKCSIERHPVTQWKTCI